MASLFSKEIMRVFKLTTEEMRSRYLDDQVSLDAIAKEAGCAMSTVHHRLTRAGVVMRSSNMPRGTRTVKVSDEDLAETVRLYKLGFSIKEVGELLHLSPTAVYYRLKHMAKIEIRRPMGHQNFGRNGNRVSHYDLECTSRLYRSGLSSTEVGEVLGISTKAVIWRLGVAGVPIRTRSESLKLRWKRRPKAKG